MQAAAEALQRVRRPVRGRRRLGAPDARTRCSTTGGSAHGRGLQVIIAGAGGAAHLPGHAGVRDAAAGHRRAGPAEVPRRYGLAAVDRADACRRSGRDRRRSATPATPVCSPSASWAQPTRACATGCRRTWITSASWLAPRAPSCVTRPPKARRHDHEADGLPAHRSAQDRDDVPAAAVRREPRHPARRRHRLPRWARGSQPERLPSTTCRAGVPYGYRAPHVSGQWASLVEAIANGGQPRALISEELLSLCRAAARHDGPSMRFPTLMSR